MRMIGVMMADTQISPSGNTIVHLRQTGDTAVGLHRACSGYPCAFYMNFPTGPMIQISLELLFDVDATPYIYDEYLCE